MLQKVVAMRICDIAVKDAKYILQNYIWLEKAKNKELFRHKVYPSHAASKIVFSRYSPEHYYKWYELLTPMSIIAGSEYSLANDMLRYIERNKWELHQAKGIAIKTLDKYTLIRFINSYYLMRTKDGVYWNRVDQFGNIIEPGVGGLKFLDAKVKPVPKDKLKVYLL